MKIRHPLEIQKITGFQQQNDEIDKIIDLDTYERRHRKTIESIDAIKRQMIKADEENTKAIELETKIRKKERKWNFIFSALSILISIAALVVSIVK